MVVKAYKQAASFHRRVAEQPVAADYRRQRAVRLLAVMAVLVITHGVARAQITPSTTLTAGQTGRIAFETITLNDSQFLKGEMAGATASIWGISDLLSA